ncbi:DUF3450 domain-containing protein [Vibrio nigripulchritudo]|uniref:DUF3450 domain-containing protein n=1 Tax=Vibrio nigripulchritudo TaxID=28173 RepID=UPI00190AE323|nr:DUF3450 domain-containing protein [Vibrio nigripulchritudo]BCL71020.1 DUF3450 domain-containing protein [Vibrio nigripulchritudo]BDU32376.1 DUF3450 domain-containing protein [Vibrio nigripulchritudo]
MKDIVSKGVKAVAVTIAAMSVSTTSLADDLDKARAIEKKTNKTMQKAQANVDANVEASFTLQSEIEQLETQIENLTLYRNHLRKLVTSQNTELDSLEQQLKDIEDTRQGIVPLMYRMIDGLESVLTSDVPLRHEARQKRLDDIKLLMGRADVAEAEKYRRILEAYQIEIDYGTKLGAYPAEIELNDGVRQVEQLYFGRVSLVSRSLDNQKYWVWRQQNKTWEELPKEKGIEINKAFAMAAKQQAPSVVTLPLSITTSEKEL